MEIGRCDDSITDKIGEGYYGTVYTLCSKENGCNYAFKITKEDSREDKLQAFAAKRGYAPKIFQVIRGDEGLGIIMEKADFTMRDKLDEIVGSTLPIEDQGAAILEILRGVFMLLVGLLSIGIVHRDVHFGNIVSIEDEWMLIDFGEAVIPSVPVRKSEYGILDFNEFVTHTMEFLFEKYGYDIFGNMEIIDIFPQARRFLSEREIAELAGTRESFVIQKSFGL